MSQQLGQRFATIEPLGKLGFSVRYPDADRETVRLVRLYQHEIKTQYPGWLSRMEFDREHGRLSLLVYPLEELPFALLNRPADSHAYERR